MGGLQGRLREQHAEVGDDTHREPHQMREAAHQGGGVARLELLETAAIDDAGDNLAGVGELVEVDGRQAVKLMWVV